MATQYYSVSNPEITSGVDYDSLYNEIYDPFKKEIEEMTKEIIDQAQGDYDFASKWLEANFKQALGTDDVERANFFKEVANSLESKVGRIVFDYQTNKYRHEEDVKLATDRTIEGRDLALKRLAEDEQVLKKEAETQNMLEREQQGATLNSRGILSSTREDATGLAGKEVGMLEEGIRDKMSALERAGLRSKDNINLAANQSLEDIKLTDARGLDDLTTTARREGLDEQYAKDYGLEKAKRELEKQKKLAKVEEDSLLSSLTRYANKQAEKLGGFS